MINFDFTTLLQTIDSARQKSVPSKPVEEGYAVTDVVNVPTKDKKKDKKVCTYVRTYTYFLVHICLVTRYFNAYVLCNFIK